jgi:nitroimidazol reductase NimA-like FMN-containing flavoprotein (pyridoxamine 5'-phosphate oxidase superfamily)
VDVDRNGLERLDRAECLRLLSFHGVGRVAVTVGALPAVFPINYALEGENVVFRTAAGTKLDAAVRGAIVAFEVDEIHPVNHTGWSVVAVGPASEVTEPAELEVVRRLPLSSWAPADRGHFVRIAPTLLSGRRLSLVSRRMYHDGDVVGRQSTAGFESCPRCGSIELGEVTNGETVNYLCSTCGACWHVELGWVRRVRPDRCPGCPSRPICTAAFERASASV